MSTDRLKEWNDQVRAFTDTARDGLYKRSRLAWAVLDDCVKRIAKNPDNADLDGEQILKKADAMAFFILADQSRR